ncbi:MAG: SRPBCC family protein [Cyanobacteria bacterium SZAS-4]|nr:SRPBCC family protein [Cyanobacteria bacterium SZAS-4]
MMYVRKLILCGLVCSFGSLPAAMASSDTDAMVTDSTVIDAPVKTVWEAMRTLRRNDPAHRRVVSSGGGNYVVEEKFDSIPVLGEAVCTYKEHEVPMQRLEYSMIKSDKLKAFEGEWELSPTADGKTNLKLSSRTDAGIHIPFAEGITRRRTAKSIQKRLDDVRDIATSTKVASR